MKSIWKMLPVLGCLFLGRVAQAETRPPISIADATISEGNSGFRDLTFVASIPAPVGFEVTARAQTLDLAAKAGSDYVASTGNRVVIPAGKTSGLLKIRILADKIEEKDEQLRIRMYDATGGFLSDGDALGTIQDDDYAGQISIEDLSLSEGNSGQKTATTLVRFSQPALHDIAVRFETKDGTAKAGTDYVPTQGTLLFKPGRLILGALVPVRGDTVIESDESFFTDILVTGLPTQKSRGVVTIRNDDEKLTGKIAFTGMSGFASGIFVMNADGTNVTSLSQIPTRADSQPNLSRDGSKIVFTSDRNVHAEIYVMNVDGTLQTRLTFTETVFNCDPVFSPDASKIAFRSRRDGNDEIYVMNANGTGVVRLTDNAGSDQHPVFSPDGRKIAWVSDRDGNDEIYVMNADGTYPTRLTNNAAADTEPCFSPDGKHIAFTSNREGFSTDAAQTQIYVMNANGTGQVRVTSEGTKNSNPTFSPSGQRIAYATARPKIGDPYYVGDEIALFAVYPDGSGQTQISPYRYDYDPSWSMGAVPVYKPVPPAKGRGKIVFTSERDAPPQRSGWNDIYIVNADGSNRTRLTTSGCNYAPDLSPDGSQIVYGSYEVENAGIWIMNADGSNQRPLTSPQNVDGGNPSFSPDGMRIVWTSTRDGQSDIWVMNTDGTGQTRLTSTPGYEGSPRFSPDGRKIVFHLGASGDIYEMGMDGSNPIPLTRGIGNSDLDISPDGKTIVFDSYRYLEGSGIFVMNADGTGQALLAFSYDSPDQSPCFSPDGKTIAFVRHSSYAQGIWLMNANGTGQTKIPNTGYSDDNPDWGPGSVPAPVPNLGASPTPNPSAGSS